MTVQGSSWTYTYNSSKRTFNPWFNASFDADYSDTKSKISLSSCGIRKTTGGDAVFAKSSKHYCQCHTSPATNTKTYGGDNWKDFSFTSNPSSHTYGSGYTAYFSRTTKSYTVTLYVKGVKSDGIWEGSGTATATWTVPPKAVSLSFGGLANTIKTTYGSKVTLPSAPYKSGYDFVGWQIGDNTYNAGSSYTMGESTTATAVWHESYVAPVISQVRAYRCASYATGFRPTPTTDGTKLYAEFTYVEPSNIKPNSSVFGITAINNNSGANIPLTISKNTANNVCYGISSAGRLPLLNSATITCTAQAIPYNSTDVKTYQQDTFVSEEKYLLDFYKEGLWQSIGIGCIAPEPTSAHKTNGVVDSSKLPNEYGTMDVAMDINFTGDVTGLPIDAIQSATRSRADGTSQTLTTSSAIIPLPTDYSNFGSGLFEADTSGITIKKKCLLYIIAQLKINSGLSAGDTVNAAIRRVRSGETINCAVSYTQTGKTATTTTTAWTLTGEVGDKYYLAGHNSMAARGVCPADNGTKMVVIAFDVY